MTVLNSKKVLWQSEWIQWQMMVTVPMGEALNMKDTHSNSNCKPIDWTVFDQSHVHQYCWSRIKSQKNILIQQKRTWLKFVWRNQRCWIACHWWHLTWKHIMMVEWASLFADQLQVWTTEANNHHKQSITWRPRKNTQTTSVFKTEANVQNHSI